MDVCARISDLSSHCLLCATTHNLSLRCTLRWLRSDFGDTLAWLFLQCYFCFQRGDVESPWQGSLDGDAEHSDPYHYRRIQPLTDPALRCNRRSSRNIRWRDYPEYASPVNLVACVLRYQFL